MPQNTKGKRNIYVVEDVPIGLIDYEEQQVRDVQVDDDLIGLANSIESFSLLQFPGVVRKPDGRFELAWGRRRLEAFRMQHAETIPVRIYEGPIEEIKALALVENMHRRQMSINEECNGVDYLHVKRNLPVDTICKLLGASRTWVMQRLAIPNFPGDCREALLDGAISLGAAEELATLSNDADRAFLLNQAIHTKASIAEVRAAVQIAKNTPLQTDAVQAGLDAAREQQTAQPVMMRCQACNQPAELGQLTLVRVHSHGCPQAVQGPFHTSEPIREGEQRATFTPEH